jgi:hypothetical protein
MPFQEGQSGNPAGRPRGARNQRTILLENIMDGESETILQTAIGKAKEGDIAAIRMVIDRIAPIRKNPPIEFELPPIEKPADAVAATAAIASAVGTGELTPAEAAQLSKVVDVYVRAVELRDFEPRLKMLEEQIKNREPRDSAW